MTKKRYYEYNHFNRLPEEIIVSIFDRIADLKCLCHCSLVSKHFALLVYHVQNVSIPVTGNATYDSGYVERIKKMVSKLNNCNTEQFQALLDSLSLQNMKFPVFLDSLTELKCIYLDYGYTGKSVYSCIPMRKIKFHSNGAKIESFVALEYSSIHKDTENVAEEEDETEHISAIRKRGTKSWGQSIARYVEWICFVIVLMKCHASLQRVTITDSEVHGKLVIGDDQGVKLDMDFLAKLLMQFSGFIVRHGWVPALDLPLSGYVMRWVSLAIAYLPENSGAYDKKLDEIEFWDFKDELPVFREAVKEFLKKHKDEPTTLEQ